MSAFFVAFLDNNNPAFHKTNSSEKTLDTRQKIFCGPLLKGYEHCFLQHLNPTLNTCDSKKGEQTLRGGMNTEGEGQIKASLNILIK